MNGRSLMFDWLLLGPGLDPDGYWRENLWLLAWRSPDGLSRGPVVSLVSSKV